MNGHEMWSTVQWPVAATTIINASENKLSMVAIFGKDVGNHIGRMVNIEEAKALATLLNWLNDTNENLQAQISEKNVLIGELEEIKRKHYQMLKERDAATDKVTPVDKRADSPARQMIERTGTEAFAAEPIEVGRR